MSICCPSVKEAQWLILCNAYSVFVYLKANLISHFGYKIQFLHVIRKWADKHGQYEPQSATTPSKKRPLDEKEMEYVFAKPIAPTPRKTKKQSPAKGLIYTGTYLTNASDRESISLNLILEHAKLSPSRSMDSALDDINKTPVTPRRYWNEFFVESRGFAA